MVCSPALPHSGGPSSVMDAFRISECRSDMHIGAWRPVDAIIHHLVVPQIHMSSVRYRSPVSGLTLSQRVPRDGELPLDRSAGRRPIGIEMWR